MPLAASIKFTSERFDYTSELPEEYNAGNRLYGRDVAEYLVGKFNEQGLASDYLDEDWGWLVFSQLGASPEFEVAIYNLAEHGEGSRPGIGEWGLWIRSFERKKLFGVLPRRTATKVPAVLQSVVEAAIRAVGTEPAPWQDGPGDA